MSASRNRRWGPLSRSGLLWGTVALLSAVVVLLTACAGDDDSDDSGAAYGVAGPESVADTAASSGPSDAEMDVGEMAAASEEASPAEEGADRGALGVPTALNPADLGREIIYRATISVQADDVAAAGDEAVDIVEGLGGLVFSQMTRTEPEPRTEIVFKVLPADFATVLERLAAVGRLVDQSVGADDVTERVVDLESRISTAEISVTRLRRLLEEAVDLSDVAEIERQLLDRETTLEVLRGQLRTLRGQVDLATITLTITQSPSVLPETGIGVRAWVSDDAEDPCLGSEHLNAEGDSTLYVCVEVENRGASTLTDVSIRSRDVRLAVDSFEARQGSFDQVAPRELLVAVLEVPVEDGRLAGRVATRGLEIGFEAEAVPIDERGADLQAVSGTAYVWVYVDEEDSLPGLRDSISDGAGLLGTIAGVGVVAIGVTIPFLPVLAILAVVVWWLRRRRARKRAALASPPSGA